MELSKISLYKFIRYKFDEYEAQLRQLRILKSLPKTEEVENKITNVENSIKQTYYSLMQLSREYPYEEEVS